MQKKLKSKLEWLLVRNVSDHEGCGAVKQLKALQRHWKSLKQKWSSSLASPE